MKNWRWIRALALLMMAAMMVPMFAVAEPVDADVALEAEEVVELEQIEEEEAEVTELEIELPADDEEPGVEIETEIEAEPEEEGSEEETPAAVTTGWDHVGEFQWRYYRDDGTYVTGWLEWEGDKYYFDGNGWQVFGWRKIGGYWYFFNKEDDGGEMVTGWHEENEHWYYLRDDGRMVTSWYELDNEWYYFDAQGRQVSGWKKIGSVWYYLDPEVMDGQMVRGWKEIGGKRYYFNNSGAMQTGWKKIDGTWYYLNSSGAMATGWKKTDGKWYYLDASGAMVTGWQQIGSKWYYFEKNGVMLCNTTRTIDGVSYTFGSTGASSRDPGSTTTSGSCRALLVAQTGDGSIGDDVEIDLTLMGRMLASVKGPNGGSFTVTKRRNVNWSRLRSYIRSAFNGVKANDVVLFYYSGHGVDSLSSGPYAGGLGAEPEDEIIKLSDLASELNSLPCKVIVMLDSCGSGAAVYNDAAKAAQAENAFNSAVIRAFSNADSGIYVDANGIGVDPNEVDVNVGDFRRTNKFYVLTACRHMTTCIATSEGSAFTLFVSQGIGRSGRMPADTNSNGNTTLAELYAYIQKREVEYGCSQRAQVYPANSGYNLFKR